MSVNEKIEFIKFEEDKTEKDFILGKVLVRIFDKMELWFSVFKSKEGKPFCKPVNISTGGTWQPAFILIDEAKMKKLCSDVRDILVNSGELKCL